MLLIEKLQNIYSRHGDSYFTHVNEVVDFNSSTISIGEYIEMKNNIYIWHENTIYICVVFIHVVKCITKNGPLPHASRGRKGPISRYWYFIGITKCA